jgi:hypothetical protein
MSSRAKQIERTLSKLPPIPKEAGTNQEAFWYR